MRRWVNCVHGLTDAKFRCFSRISGNTEVKRSKRRLATTRSESRTRFALCRLAVYIQPEPRARLTLPDLATDDREFTWVDTPDLKYFP
jgi:hypothetical protein